MADTTHRSHDETIPPVPGPSSHHHSGPHRDESHSGHDAGRVALAALLGGVVTAAGYVVYQRLPNDQRERLHDQVRGLVESRLGDLRGLLNF